MLMSVPGFESTVSTLGFTRVSHLLKMMKALRNGLTMSCTMMNSQQLCLGSDYVFLKRYGATKLGHGSLCLRDFS